MILLHGKSNTLGLELTATHAENLGPPGVGKTLTAETVALACERPLLPVSIADIGMDPSEAEQNLVDIFADAGRWEAVLLM